MKKIIIVFSGVLGAINWCAAQVESGTLLQQVEITSTPVYLPIQASANSLTVLDSAALHTMPAQSVADVLSQAAGVDVRARGVNGVQADIQLMGGGFDQTVMMLNGFRLTDPQTGHHLMNLPLNVDDVERIEILRGAGGRQFGPGALAGVINVVTKLSNFRKASFSVYGGSFKSAGFSGNLSLPVKNYRQSISLSQDVSSGYRDNTDYRTTNAFYQSELAAWGGKFKLMTGYTNNSFGANSFYTSAFPDQYEETKTTFAGLEWHKVIARDRANFGMDPFDMSGHEYEEILTMPESDSVKVIQKTKKQLRKERRQMMRNRYGYKRFSSIPTYCTVTPRVYWRRNEDRFLLKRFDPAFYENNHRTDVLGAELHGSYHSRFGLTRIGGEYRHELIRSSRLGNHDRDNLGAYIDQRFDFINGRLTITPGVYVNYLSNIGVQAYPGGEVSMKFTEPLSVFANAGRSFRLPTYTDLYYTSPNIFGNELLKPESAWTYQGGVRWTKEAYALEATYFIRQGANFIDYVADSLNGPYRAENYAKVNTEGIQVQGTVQLNRLFNFNHYIKLQVNYTNLNSTIRDNNDNRVSQYSLSNLTHQFNATLQHKLVWKIYNTVRFRMNQRFNGELYHVLDDRLYLNTDKFKIFAEGVNLLNTEYREIGTVPMPGRYFRIGLQVQAFL